MRSRKSLLQVVRAKGIPRISTSYENGCFCLGIRLSFFLSLSPPLPLPVLPATPLPPPSSPPIPSHFFSTYLVGLGIRDYLLLHVGARGSSAGRGGRRRGPTGRPGPPIGWPCGGGVRGRRREASGRGNVWGAKPPKPGGAVRVREVAGSPKAPVQITHFYRGGGGHGRPRWSWRSPRSSTLEVEEPTVVHAGGGGGHDTVGTGGGGGHDTVGTGGGGGWSNLAVEGTLRISVFGQTYGEKMWRGGFSRGSGRVVDGGRTTVKVN